MSLVHRGLGLHPRSAHPLSLPTACLRRIIKEIKANHESQTPEALARNCFLIRELNTNIAAVRGRGLCGAGTLSVSMAGARLSDPIRLLRRSCEHIGA